jgi:hypothetical protein
VKCIAAEETSAFDLERQQFSLIILIELSHMGVRSFFTNPHSVSIYTFAVSLCHCFFDHIAFQKGCMRCVIQSQSKSTCTRLCSAISPRGNHLQCHRKSKRVCCEKQLPINIPTESRLRLFLFGGGVESRVHRSLAAAGNFCITESRGSVVTLIGNLVERKIDSPKLFGA